MGQNQILLLVLTAILVGAAIAIGVAMFGTQDAGANKDAIIQDLNTLGADAYQFCVRPQVMGGGSGSYVGYTISPKSGWGTDNVNATYVVTSATSRLIVLTATSKAVEGATATISFDNFHNLISGPTTIGF